MRKNRGTSFCFFLLFAFNFAAAADVKLNKVSDKVYAEFFTEFQKGAYDQAIKTLNKLPAQDRALTKATYWNGVGQTQLQRFDLAVPLLSKVVKEDVKHIFEDAPYLLGQSYYATKNYKSAQDAFAMSAKLKYKTAASLYYLGIVQGLLGSDVVAIKTYQKIIDMPDEKNTANEFHQPAAFQIGEAKYEITQKMPQNSKEAKIKKHDVFMNEVIPAYEKVIEVNKTSPLAAQAQARINSINLMYGIRPETNAASPAPRPLQAWVIRLSEDLKYDSNLTNQASGKLEPVSYTGSFLSKTSVYAKYEFLVKDWIAITPELTSDLTASFNRSNPVVYTNDTATVVPAIRARLDHQFNHKPAAGLVEYEFNYTMQDFKKEHKLPFKSRYQNIVLGERAELIDTGSTTLKISYKFLVNSNDAADFNAPKLSIGQNFGIKGFILTSTFSLESQSARSATNDLRTYGLNNSFGLPKLFWDTNVDLAMNFTFTDTMLQTPARGLEQTYNPGITLTKELSKMWSVKLDYNFTYNKSKDKANYDYRKHVYIVGTTATF